MHPNSKYDFQFVCVLTGEREGERPSERKRIERERCVWALMNRKYKCVAI